MKAKGWCGTGQSASPLAFNIRNKFNDVLSSTEEYRIIFQEKYRKIK
jgi:hypothetical protein